jgi:hypothetical protein
MPGALRELISATLKRFIKMLALFVAPYRVA